MCATVYARRLAWNSIVEDVKGKRLNIDGLQEEQAKKELQSAEDVLPRVARECYKWLLCPVQATPADRQPTIEAFPLNTSGSALGAEIQRVCHDNELVISAWSPIHLRDTLKKLYWKDGKDAVGAMAFWEDMQRYLYLPRLNDRNVLEQAIIKGAGSKDFFGTAYGQTGGVFEGFKFGDANVQFDDTLLLIEPEVAKRYEANLPVDLKPSSGVVGGIAPPPTGRAWSVCAVPASGWRSRTPIPTRPRESEVFLWLCGSEPGDGEDATSATGRRNYQQSRI